MLKYYAPVNRQGIFKSTQLLALLLLVSSFSLTSNASTTFSKPTISIIIDDLGNDYRAGVESLNLEANITYAILPNTPHALALAKLAEKQDKEFILHLPMQSIEPLPLGPGGLTLDLDEAEFESSVEHSLLAIPGIRGVNNHMGSLLTQHPGYMHRLMRIIKRHQLFFVDSRTTEKTIAAYEAVKNGVPHISRDIFLDTVIANDETFVDAQLQRLEKRARNHGYAVGIGHPYPATLNSLKQWISGSSIQRFNLVPVSELISAKENQWQASLFSSPTVAKNLKP